jgi:hypothetical protein
LVLLQDAAPIAATAGDAANPGGNGPNRTPAVAKFWNSFIFLSDLACPATMEASVIIFAITKIYAIRKK